MIIDLETTDLASLPAPSVCVVGGGAIGLCVGVTLAKRGVSVVLLEGGGQNLEVESQALQQGESIGHPFHNIGVGRYRVLGGSTVYWGGQVLPFDRFVTGARPWLGHREWPVDADELALYFRHAYELLGLGAACFDNDQIWRSLGLPPPDLGGDVDLVFTRWLRTRNLAQHFKRELKQAASLTTVVHANVCAINMRVDGRTVRSVAVRTLSGRHFELEAKSFVLANGTLEIARLLMHPLGDGSAPSWQRSKYLGVPLIDHLDCIGGSVRIIDHAATHRILDNIYLDGYKYYPKMRLSPRAQREHGLVDVSAQFLYRTRFSEHLDYLKMFLRSIREGAAPVSARQLPRHLAAVARTAWPLAVRYFKDRRSFKPMDAEVSLVLYCEQLPNLQSRLELSDAVDALGMRRLRVHWDVDGREIKSIKYLALRIKEALESRGLAKVELDPKLLDEAPEFVYRLHDAVHQMGTARMSASPEDGLVDADLKVFGTTNLFIAGAAVFPSTGFANPTFTAIALALRLANHLSVARDHHAPAPG